MAGSQDMGAGTSIIMWGRPAAPVATMHNNMGTGKWGRGHKWVVITLCQYRVELRTGRMWDLHYNLDVATT